MHLISGAICHRTPRMTNETLSPTKIQPTMISSCVSLNFASVCRDSNESPLIVAIDRGETAAEDTSSSRNELPIFYNQQLAFEFRYLLRHFSLWRILHCQLIFKSSTKQYSPLSLYFFFYFSFFFPSRFLLLSFYLWVNIKSFNYDKIFSLDVVRIHKYLLSIMSLL